MNSGSNSVYPYYFNPTPATVTAATPSGAGGSLKIPHGPSIKERIRAFSRRNSDRSEQQRGPFESASGSKLTNVVKSREKNSRRVKKTPRNVKAKSLAGSAAFTKSLGNGSISSRSEPERGSGPNGVIGAHPGSFYYSRNSSPRLSGGSPFRSASTGPYPSRSSRKMPGEKRQDEMFPSYWVEHLATFGLGKEFGLEWPRDGIRKLKQMERSAAIWAQPMIFRLRPESIIIEDENGDMVEQFPLELVTEPTAQISNDPRDLYNNILLFVVREDRRNKSAAGSEVHIFQCVRVSAAEVVEDIKAFLQGRSSSIRGGLRDGPGGPMNGGVPPPMPGYSDSRGGFRTGDPRRDMSYPPDEGFGPQPIPPPGPEFGPGPSPPNGYFGGSGVPQHPSRHREYREAPGPRATLMENGRIAHNREFDNVSDTSDRYERDINTLNRCFDEIERFVARIQQAAIAQREVEARNRGGRRRPGDGIWASRAQLPSEGEFVDVLQKFKLSFNLLAKLRNHIHEPNAPELLHFLFTPLTVILDACRWSYNEHVAPRVVSPLISREAKELMLNCLTSKETDIWLALGDAWRVPEEEWQQPLPPVYCPVFYDGFMPYGHHGDPLQPGRSRHYSSGAKDRGLHMEMDKLSIERERIEYEKAQLIEKQRRLEDEERRLEYERRRLNAEQRKFQEDQDGSERSFAMGPARDRNNRNEEYYQPNDYRGSATHSYNTPGPGGGPSGSGSTGPSSAAHRSTTGAGGPSRDEMNGPSNGPGIARMGGGASKDSGDGGSAVEQSPRQRVFLEELNSRRARVVQVSHDRQGNNNKELSVNRGEFLEVLNDTRQWWECRNIHNRVGFVPNTILMTVRPSVAEPLFVNASGANPSPSGPSPPQSSSDPSTSSYSRDRQLNAGMNGGTGSPAGPGRNVNLVPSDAPEYVKQRQGKRGEFRYF